MRRGWIILGLALAVASGPSLLISGTAGAAVTVGSAEITQPGTNTPLRSGGSTTLYGVALPAGASCSADTEHHEYHIYTYLLAKRLAPTAVNVGKWPYSGLGTDGRFGFISGGEYVGALNTAPGTGAVVGLPEEYTWSRLTPADLFTKGESSSTWNAGIACANPRGVITNYWNTEVIFTASKTDPGGFTWRVAKVADMAVVDTHSFPIGLVFLVIAVALAFVALVMSRRRRRGEQDVVR